MTKETVAVIFHVDETEKWAMALGNVQNLLVLADPESSKIEVLANGEAVAFYQKQTSGSMKVSARSLADGGVTFTACANALRKNGIPPKTLEDYVKVVPAGVLELIEKQREGFAYIKP